MTTDLIILSNQELCSSFDSFHPDDLILQSELQKEGLRVKILPWEDEIRERAHGIIFRSVWGYYKAIPEFKRLLHELDRGPWMIWNPVQSIRWNMNKKYLTELRKAGHPIVPTKIFPAGHHLDLAQLWEEFETENLVLKPSISASAHLTFRLGITEDPSTLPGELFQHDYLVQAFMPNVLQEGEYSLIFIENEFSHCVLKSPKTGDFRVQSEYGASTRLESPPPQALYLAQNLIESLDEENIFARVDVIRKGSNQFQLIELELIEPELFLRIYPKAAVQLAQALSKRL